ncbi:MAG: DEAD/DEAH box helicase, partial [Planctomycetota bacterium]
MDQTLSESMRALIEQQSKKPSKRSRSRRNQDSGHDDGVAAVIEPTAAELAAQHSQTMEQEAADLLALVSPEPKSTPASPQPKSAAERVELDASEADPALTPRPEGGGAEPAVHESVAPESKARESVAIEPATLEPAAHESCVEPTEEVGQAVALDSALLEPLVIDTSFTESTMTEPAVREAERPLDATLTSQGQDAYAMKDLAGPASATANSAAEAVEVQEVVEVQVQEAAVTKSESNRSSVNGEIPAADERPTFRDLNLAADVVAAVEQSGYTHPTEIQARIIPEMLEGRDVLAQSQTGTGKTAAFALPILSQLNYKQKAPQVLVLAPTRELAVQVSKSFTTYAAGLDRFNVVAIYGGQDYEPQLRQLRRGVQVVVGTPGRVIDHLNRGSLDLSQLKCLVLDEADEMLNMGF